MSPRPSRLCAGESTARAGGRGGARGGPPSQISRCSCVSHHSSRPGPHSFRSSAAPAWIAASFTSERRIGLIRTLHALVAVRLAPAPREEQSPAALAAVLSLEPEAFGGARRRLELTSPYIASAS